MNNKPDEIDVCPLCYSSSTKTISKYIASSSCFSGIYLCLCNSCGYVYADHAPSAEALASYYAGYWQPQDHSQLRNFHLFQAIARAEYIGEELLFEKPVKILDVGAGFGVISEVLSRKRCFAEAKYDAVESDPVAMAALRENIFVTSVYKDLSDVDCGYDLVILSHILEHFRNPTDFLRSIIGKLRKGGYVFVEVPNSDHRYKAKNEPHLGFHSEQTLKLVLEKAGFRVVKIASCGLKLGTIRLLYMAQKYVLFITRVLPFIKPVNIVEVALRKNDNRCLAIYGQNRQWLRVVAQVEE